MKNFFKLFGIIAFTAVIGFSMLSCGGNNGGSGPLWRNELIGDRWYHNGTYIEFENDHNDSDEWVESRLIINTGIMVYYVYDLISKDDKPAGQVSSFTVKNSDNEKITFKYILAVENGSFKITQPSEWAGTYTAN